MGVQWEGWGNWRLGWGGVVVRGLGMGDFYGQSWTRCNFGELELILSEVRKLTKTKDQFCGYSQTGLIWPKLGFAGQNRGCVWHLHKYI